MEIQYYDLYTTDNYNTACSGASCKGHALGETSGWYDDLMYMVDTTNPWFVRGGYQSSVEVAGVFAYGIKDGYMGNNFSFRQVLVPNN